MERKSVREFANENEASETPTATSAENMDLRSKQSCMIGKPVALIQVPNQRLFGTKAAARYLGVHEQTLRKLTDLGELSARKMGSRRVYALEDLDRYIESLPRWYDADHGEESGTERSIHGSQS